MFYVATCLLFDRNDRLLIYLRDDKPTISFPDHWDLFGGIVEEGESPEQALVREVNEELGIRLTDFKPFRIYDCPEGESEPNRKYVYSAKIDMLPTDLTLLDGGQKITSIPLSDRHLYRFANILGTIISDYAEVVEMR